MLRKTLLPLFLFAFPLWSSAQFVLGWSGGYATPHELNRVLYVYNSVNKAGLTKEMKPVHWCQGPMIGFQYNQSDLMLELSYSRKRAKVASEFDSSGVAMTRELKVLSNTYNFGFGYHLGEHFTIGGSFDLGRFKGKGRRGPKDGIGDQDWDRLWVKDKTRLLGISIYRLYLAETVFAELNMGIVNLRFYAQVLGMRAKLDGLDHWLFGNQLIFGEDEYESMVNYGICLYVKLGK